MTVFMCFSFQFPGHVPGGRLTNSQGDTSKAGLARNPILLTTENTTNAEKMDIFLCDLCSFCGYFFLFIKTIDLEFIKLRKGQGRSTFMAAVIFYFLARPFIIINIGNGAAEMVANVFQRHIM